MFIHTISNVNNIQQICQAVFNKVTMKGQYLASLMHPPQFFFANFNVCLLTSSSNNTPKIRPQTLINELSEIAFF